MSTAEDRIIEEGLTYDDVLIVPSYSDLLPKDVKVTSMFTRNIPLNAPIVSAAMDTVTEARLAIAIASEGGIGILHKNMSIKSQAAEVRKVKRSESGMIQDPITLLEDAKVKDALKIMHDYKIGGIPVIDGSNKLVGIVTNRDLRFEKDLEKDVRDVMTKENIITVEEGTGLDVAEEILQKHKIEKLPVVDGGNRLIGLITYRDISKVKINPNSCKDSFGRLRVAGAIGIAADTMDRVDALVAAEVDAVAIDTAHGHSKLVIDLLKKIKEKYPNLDVVVGNIATAEAALELVKHGADAVKVGIGPGSICTTRIIAGIGVPQLSAVFNVAAALEGTGVPLIADGGVRFSGDIVKAIAAGASSVMLGSLFAGVDESPGETIIFEGRKFKVYRGMGSLEAMQKGSKDRYFQESEMDAKKLVPEGISGRVAYKGTLSEVLYQLIGGLKAGMGYTGSATVEDLAKAKFMKISPAAITESHPHGVAITREAPNYSR
ncbi:MAG: IMP dehydrogenase [Flavobacteriales bacterium]|nr:IMP dehydrogenase [Flavobacteriales bacterium]